MPKYEIRQGVMNPVIAKKMLGQNQRNRPVNKIRVARYAEAMAAGEWDEENPEGCASAVDTNGDLLNAQHRLLAVVESGVMLNWVFFENVDPGARATWDRGAKRTSADFLAMSGVAPLGGHNKVAAVMRMVFFIDQGNYNTDPSNLRLLETSNVYADTYAWCHERGKVTSVVVAAFVWVLFRCPKREPELDALYRQIASGEGCTPTAVLIRRVTEKKITQHDRWKACMLTLRLIQASLDGEQMIRMPYFKDNDWGELIKRVRRLNTLDARVPGVRRVHA